MPHVDPEDQNHSVMVRLPGDPAPRRASRDRADFEHREQPTDPDILAARTASAYTPETDLEALMMSAPGSEVQSAEKLAAEQPYLDAVRAAYVDSLPGLTPAQREAWNLERAELTQRDMATKLGIGRGRVYKRLDGARRKLIKLMDWVIAPEMKAKYRQPKPAPRKNLAHLSIIQQIGSVLAKSDKDEKTRWHLARLLDKALSIGVDPTELCKRTQILPTRLAQLVSDYRNG